jgi:predicted Zn-dependent protease
MTLTLLLLALLLVAVLIFVKHDILVLLNNIRITMSSTTSNK